MDMFGMMGELMGNMVSKFLPLHFGPCAISLNKSLLHCFVFNTSLFFVSSCLPGTNVRHSKLSDIFFINSHLVLLLRCRGTQSLSADQWNENRPWRGENLRRLLKYLQCTSCYTNVLVYHWGHFGLAFPLFLTDPWDATIRQGQRERPWTPRHRPPHRLSRTHNGAVPESSHRRPRGTARLHQPRWEWVTVCGCLIV